ncbi:MAG TPA: M23 family metallopeptidase [Chitinophagaceae bacterium]|nr:M23 family metallopeptidase [Chitinophagaceae bacterium]
MNERTKIIIRLLTTHIFLVIVLIGLSFIPAIHSPLWLAICESVLLITFFTGYWEFFGKSFKWMYSLSLTVIIVALFIWLTKEKHTTLNSYTLYILCLLQVFLLYHLVKIIITIVEKTEPAFEITFPFKNGSYLITDGGNSKISRLMNYHYYSAVHKRNKTNLSMLYATDMVKLSSSPAKFLPLRNEDYPIFGEAVYSPMDGTVFKIVDGIADNVPFSGNYPYNTGNTIVIKQNDYYFLLGHLQCNSMRVKEGDPIQKGQLLAAIGNSGWTERPHLHMQLIKSKDENYWYGIGVAIKFKNNNLYKNRIIRL